MLIRDAMPEDSEAACDVVRRSIVELCTLDHQDDKATLEAWLSNKTPQMFAEWSTSARHIALIAEVKPQQPAAYGLLNRSGAVVLLYVAPEARFRGASGALLEDMESRARRLDLTCLALESTATARQFYERHGFVSSGPPSPGFGCTTCYPMKKELVPCADNGGARGSLRNA